MSSHDGLTVEELAQQTGVSVRNIRYYQELGLIAAPQRRGRMAFYDATHAARLGRIAALREEGLSLEAIARVLSGTDGGHLRFMQTLLDDATNEEPVHAHFDDLQERWASAGEANSAARALDTSFFRALADGEVEVRSPALLRIGYELSDLEIPLADAVELLATLETHLGAIAESYIALFIERVWRPAVEGSAARDVRWDELEQTLVRLRGLAGESVAVAFAVLMRDATERARLREMASATLEQGAPLERGAAA
ncbi:MAG TPA: MerR family transcriptional regulator [Solirubrobacteraceae bacterium]|nr:MerR family transcriptional regulator [Solirubrobacteraceae bacterium]